MISPIFEGHLHLRGAQNPLSFLDRGFLGTSPLAWSSGREKRIPFEVSGDISTCVELSCFPRFLQNHVGGHLHLRGAQRETDFSNFAVPGTSPLAWSSVTKSHRSCVYAGDISTCVELSLPFVLSPSFLMPLCLLTLVCLTRVHHNRSASSEEYRSSEC